MTTNVIKTIKLTPTWQGIMPGIIEVLENGTEEGRKIARDELMRVAAELDKLNREGEQS